MTLLSYLYPLIRRWRIYGVLCVFPVFAVAELSFQHLDETSGLSSSAVFDILQDNHGFIWFGGGNGLHRYDGRRFIQFRHDPDDPDSLTTNTIFDLVIAKDTLWVASADGVLHQLLSNGRFLHYPTRLHEGPLFNTAPSRLAFDGKDSIWMSTNKGLFQFSVSQRQFIRRWISEDDQSFYALSLSLDGKKLFASTTRGGLYQIDLEAQDVLQLLVELPESTQVNDIFFLNDELYLVSRNRIYRVEGDRLHSIQLPTSLTLSGIRRALPYKNGLWLISDVSGLVYLNLSEDTFVRYLPEPNNPASLTSMSLSTALIDSSEQLWIGSQAHGVFRSSLITSGFSNLLASELENLPSSHDDYCDISETPDKTLYFSNCETGFRKLTPDRKTFVDLTQNLQMALRKKGHDRPLNVRAHWIENDDSIWLGTYDGLIHWDGNDVVSIYDRSENNPHNLPSAVLSIFQDEKRRLWLGTYSGLLRYDPEQDSFEQFSIATESRKAVPKATIFFIKGGGADALWLGTRGQGLWYVNVNSGESYQYRFDQERRDSLSNNNVYDIVKTSKGDWWVGTGAGLNRIRNMDDLNHLKFVRYTQKHGLHDDRIHSIVEAPDGALWLGTNSGVIRFSPENGGNQFYNYSHGLPRGAYNISASLLSRDGFLYLGGYRGLAKIDHRVYEVFRSSVPPVITGFGIGKRWQQVLNPSELPSLVLKYDDSRFAVEFATLDFSAPEFHQYRYRLLDFERQWQDPGKRAEAVYSRLPAGKYTLEVAGFHSDGSLSTGKATLNIVVQPAPWLSSMAFVIYFSLLFIISFVLFCLHRRKTKRERAYMDAIKSSEQRMVLALKGSNNAVWDWNIKTGEVFRSGLEHLGIADINIAHQARALFDYIHPDDLSAAEKATDGVLSGKNSVFSAEFRMKSIRGDWLWIHDEGEVTEYDSHSGEPLRVTGTLQNITRRKKVEEELRQLANFDLLTGLPNRHQFNQSLPVLLEDSQRENQLLALLFVDLDRFKNINDSLGHQFGDKVLVAAAHRMRNRLPENCLLSRIGGDEFTVIVSNIKHEHEAKSIARLILSAFKLPLKVDNTQVIVSVSIGVSFCPNDSTESHTLIQYADTAMY